MSAKRSEELPKGHPLPMYRHGDVGLFKIRDRTEPQGKLVKNQVVAYGEVTGHAHVVLNGTVWCNEDGSLELRADEDCRIRHVQMPSGTKTLEEPVPELPETREHDEIKVEPGLYKIQYPETYTPAGWQRSMD